MNADLSPLEPDDERKGREPGVSWLDVACAWTVLVALGVVVLLI